MTRASIVMPAHNAAGSIVAALSSLSPEAEVIQEILIVDDASSDDTGAVAARAGVGLGLPVRVIAAGVRDAGHARNIGIEQACAPLIYFLDADDRHCRGGLRRLVEAADATPQAGLIIGAHQRYRDGVARPVIRAGCYGQHHAANAARYLSGAMPPIVMGSALIRRSAIGDVRFPGNLPYDEDTLFWAAILHRALAATIDECIMIYEESTQRWKSRLTTQPVAAFRIWRQALGNLARVGIDPRTIAAREGLVAMMIAELHYSSHDYDTAAQFLNVARAAPAGAFQTMRRHLLALKIVARRRSARTREASLISDL